MKKYFRLAITLVFAICAIQPASAAIINYTATTLDDGRWQYDYTIYNDSQIDIIAFDIYFDFNEGPYSGLDLFAYPDPDYSGWNQDIFPPFTWSGVALEPWMLSAWAEDGDPLSYGGSLGVFSVVFNWAGNETPGNQMFRLWDSNWNDFAYGWTTAIEEDMPPIPEPQTFMLLGTGLLGLAAYYRRKQARKSGKQ